MLGLDTNVLVRYLVRDDPNQFARADAAIGAAAERGEALRVSAIVLCEFVWVLGSAYQYRRAEIAGVLERLLLTEQLEFEAKDDVWRALERYRSGRADFSDYLIGRRNLTDGCSRTITFDRTLDGDAGFEVLDPQS